MHPFVEATFARRIAYIIFPDCVQATAGVTVYERTTVVSL